MTATSQEKTRRHTRVVLRPTAGAVAAAQAVIELAQDPRFKDYLEVTDEIREVAAYELPPQKK